MKTTIKIHYDKKIFDNYDNATEVKLGYLLTDEVNERRIPDLEELNVEFVIQ